MKRSVDLGQRDAGLHQNKLKIVYYIKIIYGTFVYKNDSLDK